MRSLQEFDWERILRKFFYFFNFFYSFLLEKTRWTKVSERISTKNSISSVFLINDQQFRRVTQHSNEIIDQSL